MLQKNIVFHLHIAWQIVEFSGTNGSCRLLKLFHGVKK